MAPKCLDPAGVTLIVALAERSVALEGQTSQELCPTHSRPAGCGVVQSSTPAGLADYQRAEYAKWGEVVRASGARMN